MIRVEQTSKWILEKIPENSILLVSMIIWPQVQAPMARPVKTNPTPHPLTSSDRYSTRS